MQELIKKLYQAQAILHDVRLTVAVEAERFFKNSFADQGFTDASLQKWQPLKRSRRRGAGILEDTGRLKESLQARVEGDSVVVSVSPGTAYNYGRAHNEGLGNNPKRQFMGPSKKLDTILEKQIQKSFEKAFKSS